MAAILLTYLKTREILKNREAKCLGFVLTRLPTGPEMGGRRETKVREAGGSDPALKNCFRFWCLVMFAGFIQLVCGFRFLSTIMAVFRIFRSNVVSPCSRTKTIIR